MVLSKKKLWLVPALAALVAGAVTAGQAQAVPDDVGVQDVLFCDGGQQKRVFVRTDSNALAIGETGWTAIPGMQVNFVVPAEQTDHILVQFSADARLTNPNFSYALPADEILVRILLDNVEMEPPLGDHTFNSDVGQSNAVQACKRVGPGNHVITVEYQVVDPMPFVMLAGELDGMALHVQQSE